MEDWQGQVKLLGLYVKMDQEDILTGAAHRRASARFEQEQLMALINAVKEREIRESRLLHIREILAEEKDVEESTRDQRCSSNKCPKRTPGDG